ncbi:hypothetical protein [Daejeonella sp.]
MARVKRPRVDNVALYPEIVAQGEKNIEKLIVKADIWDIILKQGGRDKK